MTPLAYCNKYQAAPKQSDETYVMFINRPKTFLGYYVASRHVSTLTIWYPYCCPRETCVTAGVS